MINYIMIDPLSKISYMGEVGPYQLLIILAVVLLLFGGKKIPELMKGLGTGIKGFKDGMKGDEESIKKEGQETKPNPTLENK